MTEAEVTRRNIERYEHVLRTGTFDDDTQRRIRGTLKELEAKLATLTVTPAKPFGRNCD